MKEREKQQAIEDKRLKELKTVRKMIEKAFCAMCKTHCYAPTYRERIKEVMRYSGPRMLWIHPIMTIRHILLGKGLLK